MCSSMCEKQTSVSHKATESEVVYFLDAGLRMDGIPALDLWDLVGETKPEGNTPTPRRRTTSTEMMLNYSVWITLPQTKNFLTLALFFTLLKQSSS